MRFPGKSIDNRDNVKDSFLTLCHTSLLMCPPELLHEQAGWDGSVSSSRERLLADLSSKEKRPSRFRFISFLAFRILPILAYHRHLESISPSVMIPQHRLAILLDHVKQMQINNCLYHNTAESPSLYSDHMCDRSDFPLDVSANLTQHTDEVWYCEFSHDGSMLVTAGKDRTVLIYDTSDFSLRHRLIDHGDGVAFASWSPDDSKLITCSQDKKARVWNVEVRALRSRGWKSRMCTDIGCSLQTGRCLLTIDHHNQPVTAAGWAPDGESFVTASFDSSSQLCHWSIRGSSLYMWKGAFRVADCAISPDGRRLVAIDTESNVHVFDFRTYEQDYCLSLPCKATSVTISRDSKYMLVNLSHGEIQLIDLETTAVARRFRGQKQGEFVIRSTFGGAGENFVVSGSEGEIYPHPQFPMMFGCTNDL